MGPLFFLATIGPEFDENPVARRVGEEFQRILQRAEISASCALRFGPDFCSKLDYPLTKIVIDDVICIAEKGLGAGLHPALRHKADHICDW